MPSECLIPEQQSIYLLHRPFTIPELQSGPRGPAFRCLNQSIRGAQGWLNGHIMTASQGLLPTYTNDCSPGSQPLWTIAMPFCRSQLWLPHLDFLMWLPVVNTTCYS